MTPALAQMAAPRGFSRHGHIYVPSATDRAKLAWFSQEAEQRRIRAGGGPGSGPTKLCSPGFFGGAYGGFFTAPSGHDVWMRDAASALYYSGAAPEEIYDPGSAVGPSGTIVGKVAGNVLSPVGTPDYAQALTGGVGDPLGAGFTVGTLDSFDALGTVHHYATQTFAALVIGVRNTTTVGNYTIASTAWGGTGWTVYQVSNNMLAFYIQNAAGGYVYAPTATALPAVGVPFYALVWRTYNTQTGIATSFAATVTKTDAIGSISSALPFSLGSTGTRGVAGMTLGPLPFWSGDNAATVIAGRATWLPAWALATGAF